MQSVFYFVSLQNNNCMKKLLIITVFAGLLLTGCNSHRVLDPNKPWIIDYKDIYLENVSRNGIANYRVTDGDNWQSFNDSVSKYDIGDTLHGKNILTPPKTDTSQTFFWL